MANDKPAPSDWADAAFPGIEQARITHPAIAEELGITTKATDR